MSTTTTAAPAAPAAAAAPAQEAQGQAPLRRRLRTPIVLALVVVLAAAVVVLATPRGGGGDLDPTSPNPRGSLAVASVLEDQGVEVTGATRYADVVDATQDGGATVLVVGSELLTAEVLERLRSDLAGTDLVLLAPDGRLLEDLGLPLLASGAAADDPLPARCDLPAAEAAGETAWSGAVYQLPDDVAEPEGLTWCFPVPEAETPNGSLVVWEDGGSTVTLLGSAEPLTNDDADEPGNAAVVLHLLGAEPELVWWKVDPLDPGLVDGARPSAGELAPPWVALVGVWLVVLALLAVLWRGRRMGRLVPEPLPVVVRSVETARGRGALYRESGARDRAAQVLRADAVRRLAVRLGLPTTTPAHEVVSQAAARAGAQGPWVRDVLAGAPPLDDLSLARLADALDQVVGDAPATTPRTTDRKAHSS